MFILDCIFGDEKIPTSERELNYPDWKKASWLERIQIIWRRRWHPELVYNLPAQKQTTYDLIQRESDPDGDGTWEETTEFIKEQQRYYAIDVQEGFERSKKIEQNLRDREKLPLTTRAWFVFCRKVLPFEDYIEAINSVDKEYRTGWWNEFVEEELERKRESIHF